MKRPAPTPITRIFGCCAERRIAALALLGPAKRAATALWDGLRRWNAARKEAAEDRQTWRLALTDERVMADISRDVRPAIKGGIAHERITKEKLFLWSQLCIQCEQLELQLNSANSNGTDRGPIEAGLGELRDRATAAFKEAAHALRNTDSGTSP
ncbi:MAG TPA: hypothetical protein VN649_20950 [Ramlibacter sp.]|nr:hypothetical protein [Ramlibacter sp.]